MAKKYRTGTGNIGRDLTPEEVDENFRDSDAREQYCIDELAGKVRTDEKGAVNGIPTLNNQQKVVQTVLNSERLGGQTPEQFTSSVLENTEDYQQHKLSQDNGKFLPLPEDVADIDEFATLGFYLVPGAMGGGEPSSMADAGYVLINLGRAIDENDLVVQQIIDNDNTVFIRKGIFNGSAVEWSDWETTATKSYVTNRLASKLNVGDTAVNSNQLGGKTLSTVESERDAAITTAINNMIAGAPSAYDTLLEIANYIASDISGAAAMNTAINARVQYSDIRDDLTHQESAKPLSANQGYVLKQQVDAKINTADIIDAVNSNATNKPLSAKQGKVIYDTLSNVNVNLSNAINTKQDAAATANWQKFALTQEDGTGKNLPNSDLDAVTDPGEYKLSGGIANYPDNLNGDQDGMLIVKISDIAERTQCTQEIIAISDGDNSAKWFRIYDPLQGWTDWVEEINSDTFNDAVSILQSQINGKLAAGATAVNSNQLGGKTLATVEGERNAAIATAINNIINGAPGALDAFNELATALGNDPNFATTVTTALAGKFDKGTLIGNPARSMSDADSQTADAFQLNYLPASAANKPEGGRDYAITCLNYSAAFGIQTAYDFHAPYKIWMRLRDNSVWGAWARIDGGDRVALSDVVNNLTTSTAGKVADARTVKSLKDTADTDRSNNNSNISSLVTSVNSKQGFRITEDNGDAFGISSGDLNTDYFDGTRKFTLSDISSFGNAPAGLSGPGNLAVTVSLPLVKQEITTLEGLQYVRVYDAGTTVWTGWIKTAVDAESIQTETDFNNYVTPARYYIDLDIGAMENKPEVEAGTGTGAVLEVMAFKSGDRLRHLLTIETDSSMWVRISNGADWTLWKKLT